MRFVSLVARPPFWWSWRTHCPTTALLATALLGIPLATSGCAEESPRPPSSASRCDYLKRAATAPELETRKRGTYGALVEGCLVWRDTLTDSQQQQVAR